eukprot:TRINITY_DN7652_c0_g1_i2.p1 TRINITY_DN7652_c0_g1~~TRINITY_DN7652_c0_g1_i2.p1  ORF type:complete len:390 (-),score=115.96 TRINITY_DN7652_c0_g1_i2:67-1236(-)
MDLTGSAVAASTGSAVIPAVVPPATVASISAPLTFPTPTAPAPTTPPAVAIPTVRRGRPKKTPPAAVAVAPTAAPPSPWKPHERYVLDGCQAKRIHPTNLAADWDTTVLSAAPIPAGIHVSDVRVDAASGGDVMIGLVPSTAEQLATSAFRQGWFVNLADRCKYHQAGAHERIESAASVVPSPVGSTVRVTVAVGAQSADIAFTINNVDLGTIYRALPIWPPLSLAVLLRRPGDAVSLVSVDGRCFYRSTPVRGPLCEPLPVNIASNGASQGSLKKQKLDEPVPATDLTVIPPAVPPPAFDWATAMRARPTEFPAHVVPTFAETLVHHGVTTRLIATTELTVLFNLLLSFKIPMGYVLSLSSIARSVEGLPHVPPPSAASPTPPPPASS